MKYGWVLTVVLAMGASAAQAEDYVITFKDHKPMPAELTLPAGEAVKITVKNEDDTPMEFESHSLKREKVIPGGGSAIIALTPLKPGTYKYFDEFHEETGRGVIVVK